MAIMVKSFSTFIIIIIVSPFRIIIFRCNNLSMTSID